MRIVILLFSLLCLSLGNATFANNLKALEKDVSDSVITAQITAHIAKDKDLNPLKLSVSTHDGKVALSGYVKNKEAYVQAVKIAASVKSVRAIDTEDLEIKQVNTIFTDAYITAKVETTILKAKVLDDESIPIVGINASTDNGIVTLTGMVKSTHSIDIILKRVSNIKGVKQIISKLEVGTELL